MVKKLFLLLSITTIPCISSMPTHQEILNELAQVRANAPQLQFGRSSYVRYYHAKLEEAKVLDEELYTDSFDNTYRTFNISADLVRLSEMGDIILLTPKNAPKTYEFVGEIAKKVGMEKTPWLYLVSDENLFNAFATGFSPATSLIGLGEKLIKETVDLKALEFLIAHELSHITKRHLIKRIGLVPPFALTTLAHAAYVTYRTYAEGEYYIWPRNWKLSEYCTSAGLALTTGLLAAWQSRVYEREADMTAAQAVGAQGGIEFFKIMIKKEDAAQTCCKASNNDDNDKNDNSETNAQTSPTTTTNTTKKVSWSEWAKNFFMTHPSHDERMAYLTEFQQQHDSQVAATPAPAVTPETVVEAPVVNAEVQN